jgi:hypothetical protein
LHWLYLVGVRVKVRVRVRVRVRARVRGRVRVRGRGRVRIRVRVRVKLQRPYHEHSRCSGCAEKETKRHEAQQRHARAQSASVCSCVRLPMAHEPIGPVCWYGRPAAPG